MSYVFPVRLIFLVCSLILWKPCDAIYDSNTSAKIIGKLDYLSAELVKDVEMKINAIQFFRDQYYKSLIYQLGEMVYHMRDKFKKMIFLYQQTDQNASYLDTNKETKQTKREDKQLNKYIVILGRLYHKGMEVDQMAQMIEEFEIKRETKQHFHERMSDAMRRSGRELDRNHMEQWRTLRARVRGAFGVGAQRKPPWVTNKNNKRPGKKKNQKWRSVPYDNF